MKIVLRRDVKGVGRKHEIKDVSEGYALNYLFPKNLAAYASAGNMKSARIAIETIEAERRIQEDLVHKNLKSLAGALIEISAKANEQGHLFAGIHKEEIIDQVKKQVGVDLAAEFIDLEHPLKGLGDYEIKVRAKGDEAVLKVVVKTLV